MDHGDWALADLPSNPADEALPTFANQPGVEVAGSGHHAA